MDNVQFVEKTWAYEFHGNKDATLAGLIAKYILKKSDMTADSYDIQDFVAGTFINDNDERVNFYRIKTKLYSMSSDSWTCNNEFHWILKERTKEYFYDRSAEWGNYWERNQLQ